MVGRTESHEQSARRIAAFAATFLVALVAAAALAGSAQAVIDVAGKRTATFGWGAPVFGNAASYRVWVKRNGGAWIEDPSLATTGLTATVSGSWGESVQIAVVGVDAQGNRGAFSLPSEVVRFVPSAGGAVGVPPSADLDGDGRSDLVWTNVLTGEATVGQLQGQTASLQPVAGPALGLGWAAAASGDFDGDGRADLLMRNVSTGENEVWLMHGGQALTTSPVPSLDPDCKASASADFDDDGNDDVLWECKRGQKELWLMNGTGVASVEALPSTEGGWRVRGHGDFDGDGHADLLWQRKNGSTGLWLMDDTGRRTSRKFGRDNDRWRAGPVGDFDGDGHVDVFWRRDDGKTQVWLMNGTSVRTSENLNVKLGRRWNAVRVGDFDGDGRADVFLQHRRSQKSAVLLLDGGKVRDLVVLVGAPKAEALP